MKTADQLDKGGYHPFGFFDVWRTGFLPEEAARRKTGLAVEFGADGFFADRVPPVIWETAKGPGEDIWIRYRKDKS